MQGTAQTVNDGAPSVPDLSIVIAAYRARDIIARAICSALASTGINFEIIVVDDCSPDETAEAVEAEFARDPRVRVLRRAVNGGPGAARNDGFAAARGRWTGVLDADDFVLEDRFARLIGLGDAQQCDIVADNITYFELKGAATAGTLLPPCGADRIDLAELFRASFRTGNDYGLLKPIFRTSFLRQNEIRYHDTMRHGEDYEFVAEALYKGATYRIIREYSGYLYSTRESGFSRTQLDDQDMINRAGNWLRRPIIRNSPELRSALRGRIGTLQTLQLHRMSGGSGLAGRLRILKLALQSRAGWIWLLDDLSRRLRR